MGDNYIEARTFSIGSLIILCLVFYSVSGFCQVSNQYRTQGMIIPWYCMDSATLDIDNDGDLDIVSGHKGYSTGVDDTLTVYVNNGGMHYTQTYYVGSIANDAVCTGDFNNDGFTDIAAASWNNSIGVYYNDGHGGFGNFLQISSTRGGSILKSIDIEGDGDLDLFYLSHNPNFGNYFGFYRNHGSSFSNYLHTDLTIPEDFLSLNDMDGDGVIDVIGGGSIYLNRGNQFEIVQVPLGITWAPATTTGDYDNDGDIDIIVINPTSPLSLYILENLGDMTFQGHPDFAIIPGYYHRISPMVVHDLNNDGYADIVYMNMVEAPILTDMYLHILTNQGGTGFESQSIYFNRLETIFWFNLVEVADLNSDGNLDILISSVSPNDVNEYLHYMIFVMQTRNGMFEQWVENDDPFITPESQKVSLEAYPNPFRIGHSKELTIKIYSPRIVSSGVNKTIRVFNARGQLVRKLIWGGRNQVCWNGLDDDGNRVPSGIYIIQLDHENIRSNSRKVIVYK